VDLAAHLLSRCTFPAAGTPVTCAVSGGADSLALLVLAVHAGCDVTAVHVDHGLREGSSAEAEIVATAAARFGAAFRAERIAIAAGPNLEARARAARYAVLPADVCTGHTADDQAETVLLNLLRGASLPGLAAMRAGHRHPILSLRRHETVGLCAALDLPPLDDPMNTDRAYRRVRVRRELVPFLDELAGRDVVPILARQAELAAEAVEALDAVAAGLDPTDARAVAAAPPAIGRWALRGWIRSTTGADHPLDAAAVDRALEVARGGARAAELGGGWRIARTERRLRLERRAAD
jgi:tRNA(Ile)-lysidine synthase